jgi:hypothetical protein
MGNWCNIDNTVQTGVSGALLSRSTSLFDFKYGSDDLHPLVEHEPI